MKILMYLYRMQLLGLPPKILGTYTKQGILLAQLNERYVSRPESSPGKKNKENVSSYHVNTNMIKQ